MNTRNSKHHVPSHPPGNEPGAATVRVLKWTGIAFALLLLILASALFWLLRTESGTHFVLARVVAATDGRLAIEKSSGTLAGPLTLQGLRWLDPQTGVDAQIARARVDISILALFAKRVHVTDLTIDDVDVALTSVPARQEQPAGEFSLAAPVDVIVDHLALNHARVSSNKKPVFALDTLVVAGGWTRGGAMLKKLALRAPDGHVDMHGSLSSVKGYPGNGDITFGWTVADVAYTGTFKVTGDGRQVLANVVLTEPTAATIEATLAQSTDLPWSAKIEVPRFDPKRVLKDTTLATLGVSLDGSGDTRQANLHGTIDINDHQMQLEPLRVSFDEKFLKIEALTLRSAQAPGQLNASGEVQLAADPVSATLALDWQGVQLPQDLAGQALDTHGHLDVSGSTATFQAKGSLAIGPPGKLYDIAVDLEGTPQQVSLHQLALKQAQGSLDANGTVTLQPAIGWDLTAKADRFDPGAFAADWPGTLKFDLASTGTLTDKGPDATIKLQGLSGTLRKRPLAGAADLRVRPGYIVDGTLDLVSGKSRIQASGSGGRQTDVTVSLAIASLGDLLPNTAGHVDGQFHVQGKWPRLELNGNAHASKIDIGTTHVDRLNVVAHLSDLVAPAGKLTVEAGKISSGALAFDSLTLVGHGDRGSHELSLKASGTPLGLELALSGSAQANGYWKGTVNTLDIDFQKAPPLTLQHTAQLTYDGSQFTASDICLAGKDPRLCVSGKAGNNGSLDAMYRIEHLPLALITELAAADAPFQAKGIIAGEGHVQRSADGTLGGRATLASDAGSIAYEDHPEQPLLTYRGFTLTADMNPHSTHATVHATLNRDGKLEGDMTLDGAVGAPQSLSGHVDLVLNDLGFISLLTPEVTNTSGRMTAGYTFAGTLDAPQLDGNLELTDFATEVPAAGIRLHDGQVTVHSSDADHFVLKGKLLSGEGSLILSGTGGVGATAPLHASITGNHFLAADIPAARVVISPDLTIERSAEKITIGGSVTIPEADVDLAKLPGGGVSKTSPDVVIVDAEQKQAGTVLPVVVAVTIKLGDAVKLAGLGLDGKITGQLAVSQRPGRLATGTGYLNVSGTYAAYGQNLEIQSGRLLFAGTALDNPGLDIRAVRKTGGSAGGVFDDSITAGLQIRGTALVPVLTVFSKPSMPQSDALSYLVTGKPLSSLSSSEGDKLGNAAQALGSAGGNLLAKGIGVRTGLDAGVTDSGALGGSAFTVGKYLSPKLYLSYGVGLFTPGEVVTLRYLFNSRFNFEAQNSTNGNRAGVSYRIEK